MCLCACTRVFLRFLFFSSSRKISLRELSCSFPPHSQVSSFPYNGLTLSSLFIVFVFFCKLELFCYSFCFFSYYTSSLRRFFVFPSPVHCCSVRFTIALAIGYSCFTFSFLFSVSIIYRKVFGFRPGSHFPSLLSHYWVSRCRMVDFVRNRFLSMV